MRTNLRTVGILFAIAGALHVVALALGIFVPDFSASPVFAVSSAAFTAAFLLLALGTLGGILGRVAFWLAAAGWLILTISLLFNIGSVALVGLGAGIIGSFGAGIVVYMGKLFTRQATVVFLIAMVLGTLYLLNLIGVIVGLAFGAATVVAGVFLYQRK
jgi:hypothetical protein